MNGKEQANNYYRNAQHYLKQTEDSYVIAPSSGLYHPKAREAEQEINDTHAGKVEEHPLFISTRVSWPEIFGAIASLMGIFFSVLTLILLSLTVYFASGQWNEMVKATRATRAAAQTAASALDENKRQFHDTLQQMKAQTRTAQETLEFQNRPWISLQNFRHTDDTPLPGVDPDDWYVSYDVVNTGYSPAVRVVVEGFVTFRKNIYSTLSHDAPCADSDRESDDLRVPSLTVFREQPVAGQEKTLNFPPDVKPLINGFDFMVMCISYRDGTTSKLHHTRMVFQTIFDWKHHYPRKPPPFIRFDLVDAITD